MGTATKSLEDVLKKIAVKETDQRTIIDVDFAYLAEGPSETKPCFSVQWATRQNGLPLPRLTLVEVRYVMTQLLNATVGDFCLIRNLRLNRVHTRGIFQEQL